ncbi:MATE family efflux transporter, partial [Chloroflexota bacterium]
NGMERSFANVVLMWFIVPFGTAAVAAHPLVQRIDSFLHMPVMGLGQASGILAGQNLGANQPERAEKTGWQAAILVTLGMLIGVVVVWFWAEHLVGVFNKEPALVEIASHFMRIQIVSYLVFGFVIVLMNCINGVGDTIVTMLVTLATMWGMQVPLAYLLPKYTGLGVYGVRWAIVSAMVARAIIFTGYFKSGRWKRKQV